MSIHRKKDGRWYVNYRDKKTGKVKSKYFGRGLEAERNAREYNDSINLRQYVKRTPAANSVYFADLANAYMKGRMAKMQESTLDNLLWKLKGVIFPELGHNRAMNINENRIDLYVAKRLKTGVKRTTIHRELSDIRAILNWGVRRRYIAFNPMATYEMPDRDDEIIQPPSREEAIKMLSNSPPHLIRSIIMSYYTGVRPGARELFSRTWDHVNFNNLTIFIESAKKGGIHVREIPIHRDLLNQLNSWFLADIIYYEKKGFFPEAIIHYRGHSVKSLKKSFKSAKNKSGITRRLRPYDFRHAFASITLKKQSDLKSVSEILGHSRTETTTRIYQHTDTDMHRQAVNNIPPLDH